MDKEKEMIDVIDKMTMRLTGSVNKDGILKYLLSLSDKDFNEFIHKVRKERKTKWNPRKNRKYKHKATPDDDEGPRYNIKYRV